MTGLLRTERFEDLNVAIAAATAGLQAKIWTAMPGILQTVDLVKMTCKVQVAIMAQVRAPDGTFSWVAIKPLLDCPLVFPSGGGFTLTFPVAAGDEALVIFASRCIDAWWQSGGFKNVQMELRMHNLSDGFVLVGPRSQPRVLPNVSADSVQLRSDDGETFVEIDGDGKVNIKATQVHITGPVVVVGEVTANGIPLSTHHHGGVQVGGDNTGGPAA